MLQDQVLTIPPAETQLQSTAKRVKSWRAQQDQLLVPRGNSTRVSKSLLSFFRATLPKSHLIQGHKGSTNHLELKNHFGLPLDKTFEIFQHTSGLS